MESSRPQEHSSRRQKESSRIRKDSAKPVNVVNNMLTNKLKAAKIKSTSEISPYLSTITDAEHGQKLVKLCHTYERMIKSQIDDISRDLIWRIVLSEELLGSEITLEHINKWKNEAIKAEKEKRVKKAYMAFANNVRTFYEKHGVEWTKCRPNNIRQIEKDIENIKLGNKLAFLNSQVTVDGKEIGVTVANMISNGGVDKISLEDAKRLLESDDPPYKERTTSKKG